MYITIILIMSKQLIYRFLYYVQALMLPVVKRLLVFLAPQASCIDRVCKVIMPYKVCMLVLVFLTVFMTLSL